MKHQQKIEEEKKVFALRMEIGAAFRENALCQMLVVAVLFVDINEIPENLSGDCFFFVLLQNLIIIRADDVRVIFIFVSS